MCLLCNSVAASTMTTEALFCPQGNENIPVRIPNVHPCSTIRQNSLYTNITILQRVPQETHHVAWLCKRVRTTKCVNYYFFKGETTFTEQNFLEPNEQDCDGLADRIKQGDDGWLESDGWSHGPVEEPEDSRNYFFQTICYNATWHLFKKGTVISDEYELESKLLEDHSCISTPKIQEDVEKCRSYQSFLYWITEPYRADLEKNVTLYEGAAYITAEEVLVPESSINLKIDNSRKADDDEDGLKWFHTIDSNTYFGFKTTVDVVEELFEARQDLVADLNIHNARLKRTPGTIQIEDEHARSIYKNFARKEREAGRHKRNVNEDEDELFHKYAFPSRKNSISKDWRR
ncbi:unnamed protein product, partial [Mesorhabditis spiculigera]